MVKAVILLVLMTAIAIVRILSVNSHAAGESLSTRHTFLDNPKTQFGRQIFVVEGVRVYVPSDPQFFYGDTVFIKGKIEQKQSLVPKPHFYLVVDPVEIRKDRSPNPFLGLIRFLRERINTIFSQNLPSNEAGLLMGIVFGIRQNLSSDLYSALRSTGVLHVIAASGANVSIVTSLLLFSFSAFLGRRASLLVTAFAVVFYAFFSGFAPSIVRASVMAIAAIVGMSAGRQNFSLLSLSFTALIMVIFSPTIISDVGFQLSFASSAGILVIKPALDRLIVYKNALFEDFTTTVSAQIASMPVLLSSFGSYSLVSIFVNVLVLWTIPILMVLGGVAAILGLILPVSAVAVLYLSYPLILYFEKMVLFFSKMTIPINIERVPIFLTIGYYLLLVSTLMFFQKLRKK